MASHALGGEYNEELGVKDVIWVNASGTEMKDCQWNDEGMRCFGMLIDGRAQPTGIRKRGSDATILLVFNALADGANFTLPECPGGDIRTLKADTNQPDGEEARQHRRRVCHHRSFGTRIRARQRRSTIDTCQCRMSQSEFRRSL